jgi:hypothetical protein
MGTTVASEKFQLSLFTVVTEELNQMTLKDTTVDAMQKDVETTIKE